MKQYTFLFVGCFLIVNISFCQQAKYKRYRNRTHGGLCSTSLILYEDGTYVHERGCEGSSYISFAKYIAKKDSLKFTPIDNKTFGVIKKVDTMQTHSDSISITILDRDGLNITHQLLMLFISSDKRMTIMADDSSGTKKVAPKVAGGEIVLRTLNRLFHQRFNFATDSANSFVITLNLPAECVYKGAQWGDADRFTLLKQGDKLVDPNAYDKSEHELEKE